MGFDLFATEFPLELFPSLKHKNSPEWIKRKLGQQVKSIWRRNLLNGYFATEPQKRLCGESTISKFSLRFGVRSKIDHWRSNNCQWGARENRVLQMKGEGCSYDSYVCRYVFWDDCRQWTNGKAALHWCPKLSSVWRSAPAKHIQFFRLCESEPVGKIQLHWLNCGMMCFLQIFGWRLPVCQLSTSGPLLLPLPWQPVPVTAWTFYWCRSHGQSCWLRATRHGSCAAPKPVQLARRLQSAKRCSASLLGRWRSQIVSLLQCVMPVASLFHLKVVRTTGLPVRRTWSCTASRIQWSNSLTSGRRCTRGLCRVLMSTKFPFLTNMRMDVSPGFLRTPRLQKAANPVVVRRYWRSLHQKSIDSLTTSGSILSGGKKLDSLPALCYCFAFHFNIALCIWWRV